MMTDWRLAEKLTPGLVGRWLESRRRIGLLGGILYKLREAARIRGGLAGRILRLMHDIAAEERQEQKVLGFIAAAEDRHYQDKARRQLRRLSDTLPRRRPEDNLTTAHYMLILALAGRAPGC